MSNTVYISGATSAIAQAYARLLASRGASFYLVGRDNARLDIVKQDLLSAGAGKVAMEAIDFTDTTRAHKSVTNATTALGHIDIAVIAQGSMPDEQAMRDSPELLSNTFAVNATSAMAQASALAGHFQQQGNGSLLMVSSVAGDRGRQSNYIYGSTKAALSTFTDGMRNQLAAAGINIITVKPGFVDTPMTSDYPKGPLYVKPEQVARDMDRAVSKGRSILYTPWFWRYIMFIIRHIPESIFKRLSL